MITPIERKLACGKARFHSTMKRRALQDDGMRKFTTDFKKNIEKHLQSRRCYAILEAPLTTAAKIAKFAGFASAIMHIREMMAENARIDDGAGRRFLPEEKGRDHEAIR